VRGGGREDSLAEGNCAFHTKADQAPTNLLTTRAKPGELREGGQIGGERGLNPLPGPRKKPQLLSTPPDNSRKTQTRRDGVGANTNFDNVDGEGGPTTRRRKNA